MAEGGKGSVGGEGWILCACRYGGYWIIAGMKSTSQVERQCEERRRREKAAAARYCRSFLILVVGSYARRGRVDALANYGQVVMQNLIEGSTLTIPCTMHFLGIPRVTCDSKPFSKPRS